MKNLKTLDWIRMTYFGRFWRCSSCICQRWLSWIEVQIEFVDIFLKQIQNLKIILGFDYFLKTKWTYINFVIRGLIQIVHRSNVWKNWIKSVLILVSFTKCILPLEIFNSLLLNHHISTNNIDSEVLQYTSVNHQMKSPKASSLATWFPFSLHCIDFVNFFESSTQSDNVQEQFNCFSDNILVQFCKFAVKRIYFFIQTVNDFNFIHHLNLPIGVYESELSSQILICHHLSTTSS